YEKDGLTKKEATTLIHKQDGNRGAWIDILFKIKDPWDPEIYDLVIPMDKTDVKNAAALIGDNAKKEALKHTDITKNFVADFLLAAKTEVALADEGHNVDVSARSGIVTIKINKHVLMLSRLEDELKAIAGKIPDVRSVKTEVGEGYYRTDSYRKYDFEMPSKVLLVDDEREFVQTLSERLLMRDMGSAVAYDGESALDLIKDEEPEVMILDLKMPGIDGIEVLRRVKSTNPDIEVIILTGHGSEQDRKTCMDLGAFAYLHKPVDIELLSDTIKQANEKMRENFNQRA
ncbi:MAG: response regulator, partial [Desulfosarcina sp.]|nr:response regulator [Desulfobacterales bacterium]